MRAFGRALSSQVTTPGEVVPLLHAPMPVSPGSAVLARLGQWSSSKWLGQGEIIESRRIAEGEQDGAASPRGMGPVSHHRLDIPLRAQRIGDALVDELPIQDVRRLNCSLVQVSGNLAP